MAHPAPVGRRGPIPPGCARGAADVADGDSVGRAVVAAGYPAGLEVGTSVVLAGFSDDDGTRIHLARTGAGEPDVVYRHAEDGGVGALTTDETVWVLSHSEHGDSRYPALRAVKGVFSCERYRSDRCSS